jgi:hypothetical protein
MVRRKSGSSRAKNSGRPLKQRPERSTGLAACDRPRMTPPRTAPWRGLLVRTPTLPPPSTGRVTSVPERATTSAESSAPARAAAGFPRRDADRTGGVADIAPRSPPWRERSTSRSVAGATARPAPASATIAENADDQRAIRRRSRGARIIRRTHGTPAAFIDSTAMHASTSSMMALKRSIRSDEGEVAVPVVMRTHMSIQCKDANPVRLPRKK